MVVVHDSDHLHFAMPHQWVHHGPNRKSSDNSNNREHVVAHHGLNRKNSDNGNNRKHVVIIVVVLR